MSETSTNFKQVLRLLLPDPIVGTRVYPVTSHGDALLRAARRHITETIARESGKEYEVPFPTALYMVLRQWSEANSVEVLDEDRIPLRTNHQKT